MNFLSVQNSFVRTNNNNSFSLSESPSKTAFIPDNQQTRITENNNQINMNGQEKTLKEVWSKHKFNMNKAKVEPLVNFNNVKMTWAEERSYQKSEDRPEDKPAASKEKKIILHQYSQESNKEESPPHHARRPPNAFLIFCKKHRPIVRDRFPNLENRGVTKILGEWWALLNNNEKQPYNDLAKEYKDAFLSANPNFRWYKLPAPPLRTLTTRPMTITKIPPPLSSPSSTNLSEFTPGKLADESQLGGLTSLMNSNFTSIPKTESYTTNITEDNNNENTKLLKLDSSLSSPIITIQTTVPPKPIKKRFTEFYLESKECARNILPDEPNYKTEMDKADSGNMTKQDIMNKVVDGLFAKEEDPVEKNGVKETRKSERMCKGKRYEIFMLEGKLLGNKRETKFIQQKFGKIDSKIESELNIVNNNKPETPKLDLGYTIKRLAERTNVKFDFDNQSDDNNEIPDEIKRVRSISETSEGSSKNSTPNFNLDLRISNLPCLSYDEFMQRKRESKKRKIRKTDADIKHTIQKLDRSNMMQPIGSKKRKNKQSITHLGKPNDSLNNELLGLATLAEVAANTEKINEKISE